ncbi:hypothetical protein [Azospirillum sp. sgz302134]
MGRNSWFCFVVALAAGFALAHPARAQDGAATGDRIGNWTIGALAYATGEPSEPRVSDLYSKVRIGTSLLPKLEPYADIRPWVAVNPQPVDGSLHGMGGILIDVPLGSFVFTPSVGAGTLPRATRTARDPSPTMEFRSQLELGYEFENKSRFSLGYSRIDTTGSPAESGNSTNNVFGFYYRLPIGALTGQ